MERSGLRSHLSGSVPISIAMHLVALLLFLIIPLTASIELPDPAWHVPDYMPAVPVPPPPPVARVPTAASSTPNASTHPDVAPISPPDGIEPEAALPGPPDLALQTAAGVPEGIGIMATDKPRAGDHLLNRYVRDPSAETREVARAAFLAYGQALLEIARQIETESISVDLLSEKVKRASELLLFCQEKLRTTETEVNQIIRNLELPETTQE